MARRWGRLFLLIFVLGAGLLPRADARPLPSSAAVWRATGCDERYPRSELNGIDSTISDAGPWAGSTVKVQWTAPAYPPTGVEVEVVDGACKTIGTLVVARQGAFFLTIPAGAAWVVFHHHGMPGCRFSWA